jgi:hypothetical protein
VRPVVGASSSPCSGSAVRDPHVRAIIVRYPSFSCKSLRGGALHPPTSAARNVPPPGPLGVSTFPCVAVRRAYRHRRQTRVAPHKLTVAQGRQAVLALAGLVTCAAAGPHARVPMGEIPAYLREKYQRTYGRNTRVPTGEAPRTYGRNNTS